MIGTNDNTTPLTADELSEMHNEHRKGGAKRSMAPHVVYSDASCPHAGCGARLQAIDFCLEKFGRDVHHPLIQAWWNDTGFAGRCPRCRRWIHFTIRGKRPISADEAARLPNLPDGWEAAATIL